MFKGFDRHELLKRKYAKDIRSWFPINNLEPYIPEDPDDEYNYKAAYLGSVLSTFPSGKVYAFWTSNQTRHDEQRDEAFREALEEIAEEIAEEKTGYIEYYSDDIFYVEYYPNPKVPSVLSSVIRRLNWDLFQGPTYLDKYGNIVSMFDEEYHHAFDFKRAGELVMGWFEDNSPSNEWTRTVLGDELYNTIR